MSVQFVQQRPPGVSTSAGESRRFRPSARGSLDPGGRTPDAPVVDMELHRCSNPECRLYGVRVWLGAGADYTCECGDPATLSRTAREHLAAAREALRAQGAKA